MKKLLLSILICSFSLITSAQDSSTRGTLNGHEWVDLGIRKSHYDSRIVPGSSEDKRIVFATNNIGAENFKDVGYLFRWGEQEGWVITRNPNTNAIEKVTQFEKNGNVKNEGSKLTEWPLLETRVDDLQGFINISTLVRGFLYGDAATFNWGKEWHMMTFDFVYPFFPRTFNYLDLFGGSVKRTLGSGNNSITLTFEKENDGLVIKNESMGTSIYLPEGSSWLASQATWTYTSYSLWLSMENEFFLSSSRQNQLYPIRPIAEIDLNIPVSEITLSPTQITLKEGETVTINSSVLPSNATNNEIYWGTSDESVAIVTSNGVVIAVGEGKTIISASAQDGSGVYNQCEITVIKNPAKDTESFVDLGLSSGTLWATCNLGASNPYEYGDYYAWGETTPNKNDYTEGSYIDPLYSLLPANICGTEYDAAYVNLGPDWRMPSYEEICELLECNWEFITLKGVVGYMVIGPNNNHIFLPLAGGREGLYTVGGWGRQGFYASGTKYFMDDSYNWYIYMDSNPMYGLYAYIRTRGQSIRPVRANATGIYNIFETKNTVKSIFTIDGKQSSQLNKGLNIIKTNDGKTKKVIVK